MIRENNPTQSQEQEEDFGELTEQQKIKLEQIRVMFGTSKVREGQRAQAEVAVENFRLGFLLTNAFTELRVADPLLFKGIVELVQMNDALPVSLLNEHRLGGGRKRIHPEQPELVEPEDLEFSDLYFASGAPMRAALIGWLSRKPHTEKINRILVELQKLFREQVQP